MNSPRLLDSIGRGSHFFLLVSPVMNRYSRRIAVPLLHKSRAIHTTAPALKKHADLHYFSKLPGEGTVATKGVERLLGPLRADRFANSFPTATTDKDVFDVAIGKRVHSCLCGIH